MSEQLSNKGAEQRMPAERLDTRENLEKAREQLEKGAEKARSTETGEEQKQAHELAEKLAIAGKEKAPSGSENKRSREPVHHSVKKQTYKATMRRVEGKLPAYQRSFSRIINNDTVDKVSNISAKTVARPSALLGAGFFAFLGLLSITYLANRYGFTVSNTTFLVLIAVGWTAGLVIEGLLKAIRRG